MKRLEIFRNAYTMYMSGSVIKDSESENKIYYSVTDVKSEKTHLVAFTFNVEHSIVNVTCPCTIQSLKSQYLALCAHILSSSMRAVYDLGRHNKKI